MAASVVQYKTAVTNGVSPFSVTLDAAPTQGNVVCVIVNSDTTMTSGPSGYTSRATSVANQGAYVWDKTAGASESPTITVTPNGSNPTVITAIEITATTGFDTISAVASTQSSSSQVSRTINSLTTAAGTGDLVIATVLDHSYSAANPPSSPSWNNNFTALASTGTTTSGSNGLNCIAFSATASVAPSTAVGTTTCSWTHICADTMAWHIAYKSAAMSPPGSISWLAFLDSADQTLFQDLVAFYDFDNNTTDTSGQGNDANTSGTFTTTTDHHGTANGAYTFNGTNNYMTTTNSLNSPQDYSANVWFKTSSTGGVMIAFTNAQTGTGETNYDRILWVDTTGHVNFGVWINADHYITSPAAYNDGQWHMATATMSSTTGMGLYVDGVSVATDGNTSSQVYTGWWRIGQSSTGSWPADMRSFFTGSLDDVRIYSVALNATQVTELYTL